MALATLLQGSTGLEVQNLQRALNYHLPEQLPPLAVDGIFGPKTRARLIAFQRAYDLNPDAIVGPKTQQALYSFVEIRHGLMPRIYRVNGPTFASRLVGDSPLPPMPPLPPLRLPPFPNMRVPVPTGVTFPLFQPIPYFRLDPYFHLWLRTKPFELEVGTNLVFRERTKEDKPGGTVYLEATARVWSAPIIGQKLTASAVLGFGGETRISDGHTEIVLFGATALELKNIVKIGPLDILTMQLEGALEKPTDKKPVDMKGTFEVGPVVETKYGAFQIGGYLEVKTNGTLTPSGQIDTRISGGVFLRGIFAAGTH